MYTEGVMRKEWVVLSVSRSNNGLYARELFSCENSVVAVLLRRKGRAIEQTTPQVCFTNAVDDLPLLDKKGSRYAWRYPLKECSPVVSKDVGCRSNFDPSRPLYTQDTSFGVKSSLTAVRQGAKVPSSDIFGCEDRTPATRDRFPLSRFLYTALFWVFAENLVRLFF